MKEWFSWLGVQISILVIGLIVGLLMAIRSAWTRIGKLQGSDNGR